MQNITVFLLGFLSLSLFSCPEGRRVPGSSAPNQTISNPNIPAHQTIPPGTIVGAAYNCRYIGGHQIVWDYSCSKRFCYTFSYCQGHGSVFLFCEAALNAEGKYSCPSASACAGSTTVSANPGLAPYLWKNNCGGGGGYEEEDDEPLNIPNDRGP